MKNVAFLFICLGLTFLTSSFARFSPINSNDEKIDVYFSNKLDFNDLVKMKLDLSQKQVIVNYQTLEFDNNGKLKSIGFGVISEGKYCGSGKTNNLTKEYGFRIDKSTKAEIYFSVGLTR